MIFPKSTPEKNALRERDKAKANVDRLALKITAAEDAVITAKALTQSCAMSGDDVGLGPAEATERDALHRLGTIVAAHAESENVLALLEAKLATMADQKLRTATAISVNKLADELIEAGAAYDASTAILADVSTRVLPLTFEATGLSVFSQSSRAEVRAAVEVVSMILREHGRAVLNGLAPAEMPKPGPEPGKLVAAPPKAPTVRVFSTKPIKWLDQDGKQVSGGKCCDIDLPVAVAERALACGAVVRLDHPSRVGNLGRWPGNYSLNVCDDLDATDAAAPQHDPIKHSAFEPIDRGKPFTLKIAVGGAQ
jgi:hypothetical protein